MSYINQFTKTTERAQLERELLTNSEALFTRLWQELSAMKPYLIELKDKRFCSGNIKILLSLQCDINHLLDMYTILHKIK